MLERTLRSNERETCQAYLKDPPSGQDGGHGGRGGSGGLGGYAKIVYLRNGTIREIETRPGPQGPGGSGGMPGSTQGCIGMQYDIIDREDIFRGSSRKEPKIVYLIRCEYWASGSPGVDNYNEIGLQRATRTAIKRESEQVINQFISFASPFVPNGLLGQRISQMMWKLTDQNI